MRQMGHNPFERPTLLVPDRIVLEDVENIVVEKNGGRICLPEKQYDPTTFGKSIASFGEALWIYLTLLALSLAEKCSLILEQAGLEVSDSRDWNCLSYFEYTGKNKVWSRGEHPPLPDNLEEALETALSMEWHEPNDRVAFGTRVIEFQFDEEKVVSGGSKSRVPVLFVSVSLLGFPKVFLRKKFSNVSEITSSSLEPVLKVLKNTDPELEQVELCLSNPEKVKKYSTQYYKGVGVSKMRVAFGEYRWDFNTAAIVMKTIEEVQGNNIDFGSLHTQKVVLKPWRAGDACLGVCALEASWGGSPGLDPEKAHSFLSEVLGRLERFSIEASGVVLRVSPSSHRPLNDFLGVWLVDARAPLLEHLDSLVVASQGDFSSVERIV